LKRKITPRIPGISGAPVFPWREQRKGEAVKFLKTLLEDLGRDYITAICFAGIVSIFLWVGFSFMEARTYSKLTGTEVKTADAMFVQLRVIEPAKTEPKIVFDDQSYASVWYEENEITSPANREATMYSIKRSDEEINEVLNKTADGIDGGSKYPGMSFEEGIQQFADWLFNEGTDHPFEE
jgi:hypothetical protein